MLFSTFIVPRVACNVLREELDSSSDFFSESFSLCVSAKDV